jgi:large subunit ribosomal protein L14e
VTRQSYQLQFDFNSAPSPLPSQALIDGPESITGVARHVINFKWVALTDLKVAVARNARQAKLVKEWKEADVVAEFAKSAWSKKIAAKKAKAASTDFDRFKIKVAKQKASAAARKKLGVA